MTSVVSNHEFNYIIYLVFFLVFFFQKCSQFFTSLESSLSISFRYYVHVCYYRTDLQTFEALQLTQVLLQEQQVDAEVVIATGAGVQLLAVAEGR